MRTRESRLQAWHPGWAAVLWDVDGTIAETERDGHRVAFNEVFTEAGLDWHWSAQRYGELLSVTGGRERLLAYMAADRCGPPADAQRELLARALHVRKNQRYARLVAQGVVQARPGVLAAMRALAQAGVPQGIATTTSRANVQALMSRLLGAGWQRGFAVVVCGEDCARKKPDPEVYVKAVQALGLDLRRQPVLAVEDAAVGVQAADQAGLHVLWRPGQYSLGAGSFGARVRRLSPDEAFNISSLRDW
jgi:HAD superfamily hydrolase (TIGR01509 family)